MTPLPTDVQTNSAQAKPAQTLLILGASGKVGQQLLAQALSHPAVAHVVAPSRRPLPAHPKLLNPIVDYRQLAPAAWWRADACLCALGTTLALAGSRQAFAEVDHDHVLAAARRTHAAGTPVFVLNSSLGARAGARNFYLRVKGQTEDDLAELGFASLVCVRPSLLDAGPRADARPGEAAGLVLMKLAGPLVPRRWRAVPTAVVAQHMLTAALQPVPGRRAIESEALVALRA